MGDPIPLVNASQLTPPVDMQNFGQQPIMPQQPIQQPQFGQSDGLLSQILGQYVNDQTAKAGNGNNLIQQILAGRFQPNSEDVGRSSLQTSMAFGAPDLFKAATPHDAAIDRFKTELTPYAGLADIQHKLATGKADMAGGATGVLINRLLAENPGMSFQDALYRVQTGFRQGTSLDPSGNIINTPGSLGALTNISNAKQTGSNISDLNFKPQIAGAEVNAKVSAENQTKANFELPTVIDQANNALGLIEDLKNHPGMKYATGYSSVMPVVPGTAQADFVTRLEQIQGQNFLQAYTALKGGGAISEVEGLKATNAIARMNRRQSPDDFKKSLSDLENVVKDGLKRAKLKAGASDEGLPIPDISQSIEDPNRELTPEELTRYQQLLQQKGAR